MSPRGSRRFPRSSAPDYQIIPRSPGSPVRGNLPDIGGEFPQFPTSPPPKLVEASRGSGCNSYDCCTRFCAPSHLCSMASQFEPVVPLPGTRGTLGLCAIARLHPLPEKPSDGDRRLWDSRLRKAAAAIDEAQCLLLQRETEPRTWYRLIAGPKSPSRPWLVQVWGGAPGPGGPHVLDGRDRPSVVLFQSRFFSRALVDRN